MGMVGLVIAHAESVLVLAVTPMTGACIAVQRIQPRPITQLRSEPEFAQRPSLWLSRAQFCLRYAPIPGIFPAPSVTESLYSGLPWRNALAAIARVLFQCNQTRNYQNCINTAASTAQRGKDAE
jgi:hypothetical protein